VTQNSKDGSFHDAAKTEYDKYGRIEKEISPKGNVYDYDYYPSGKVDAMTDPEGFVTRYTYDIFGNLETESRTNGDYKYEYDYDYKSYSEKGTYEQNVVTKTDYIGEGSTLKTETIYDYAGRVVEQKVNVNKPVYTTYYPNGNVESVADSRGNTTDYYYENAMSSSYSEIEVISQQSEYVQVVAYEDRTVGLKSDGTVWEFNVTPKQIEGLSNIKSVFCTNQHGILAVSKDDGRILKYTSDGYKEFTKLKHVRKISGGSGHTLYLTEEGSVYASGLNYGFLGIEKGSILGYTVDEPVEVNLGGKKAIDIAASGWAYSLVVIDDGTVYGFGKNDYGQLGIPVGADASEPIYLPVIIPNLTDVKAVAVSPSVYNRAYVLKNDGSIWSWGYFDSSLGIGESSEKIIPPTEVIDNSGLRTESIAVSTYTLQAIKEDGSLWNCGVNYGDLGIGYPWSFVINKLNYKNPTINNIKSISAGYHHVVAQKNDGSVWVWGENRDGQLGTGDEVTRYYPESISKRRDCYFEALYIYSGYGNGSNSYTYLYNPKSTKLTCSVPKGQKSAKIRLSEDDMFAGLTYNVTQAETLPGKAKIEIKENGSVVKEYSINFLEPSDTFYSSTDGSIDYGGDSNMYFIGLEKDKTYKIYSTGNTDTFLEVRDDNFEICESNDDGETGANFCLTFTPEKTTNYVLIVKHFDEQAGTGKYNICIQDATNIEGLKEDEEYLDELTKEVLGTLTKDTSGNYIVKIDEQHKAVISDYRIDPYTEKPIVKFVDFIKAFNGYLPYIESPSTEMAMADSDPERLFKITTSKKGVYESETNEWDSNVVRIKIILKLLGCGEKYVAGRTFETLDETGYYGQYTFDAVSAFQKRFMRNTDVKYGEVDENTAVELQEYCKCYTQGYSDKIGWVKEDGVKVREYLTQVLNNTGTLEYRFEDSKDCIYYRKAGTSSLVRLEISSLKYYDKEYKCYAKIKDILYALAQYQINTSNMPTVVLKSPTNGGKYYVGQTIVIKATGTNCDHMAVYVNGKYGAMMKENGSENNFEYSYVFPSVGTYSIYVVGRNLPTGGALASSNVIKLSCVGMDNINLDSWTNSEVIQAKTSLFSLGYNNIKLDGSKENNFKKDVLDFTNGYGKSIEFFSSNQDKTKLLDWLNKATNSTIQPLSTYDSAVINAKKNLGKLGYTNLLLFDEFSGIGSVEYNSDVLDFISRYGLNGRYSALNSSKTTLYSWLQMAVDNKILPVDYVYTSSYETIKSNGQASYCSDYGGIDEPKKFLEVVYNNNGYTLGYEKTLCSKISNFTQGYLEPNAGNCTLASITRILKYFGDQGYTKIPVNTKDIYIKVRDIGVNHGYKPSAPDSGVKSYWYNLVTYNPFEIDNMVQEAWDAFNYQSGKGNNKYTFTFDTIKNEIDNNRPMLLNIGTGDYSGHTVTIIGYKYYNSPDRNSYVDKPFLQIYDGWSDEIRYIDYTDLRDLDQSITTFTVPSSK